MKKVMFISSTGGHLTELLALQPLFSSYNSLLVVERQKFAPNVDIKTVFLPKGTRENLIQYLFVFSWLCLKSIYYYLKFRPDVVVTTGAHTAVPMCYLAAFFKKKIIYVESIARVNSKSLTGKLLEKKATYIIVQWESMLTVYPNAVYLGALL